MSDGLFPATLDEQLLFATTPVFYEDQIIGTGFFFRADPQLPCFLITAFHVFQNIYARANKTIDAECVVEQHLATGKRVTEGYVRVRFKLADVRVHHAEDLAAVRLKEAFFESVGQKNDRLPAVPFFRSLEMGQIQQDADALKTLPACLTVLMPGYPAGFWDDHHRYPLLRTGSTASHPGLPFRGRPEGRLNMATAPIDSGAPIIGKLDLVKQGVQNGGVVSAGALPPHQPFVFLGVHIGAETSSMSQSSSSMALTRYLQAHLLTTVNGWEKPGEHRWGDTSRVQSSDQASPLPDRRNLKSSVPFPPSPTKSPSCEDASVSPAAVTAHSLSHVPAKQSQRLHSARQGLTEQLEGNILPKVELAYCQALHILNHLNRGFASAGRRFHAPAIFGDERAAGFEVVWYPGLTMIIGPSFVRCFDGKRPEPQLSWNQTPLADGNLDQILDWLRRQSELLVDDAEEETDEDTDD